MPLLRSLRGPEDLRALPADQLPALAAEIRDALVTSVAKTGGHLGPNLGCVELTIALHRVFESPREPIVFDTGHQAYVHKMLTGRVEGFERLRQRGGLSGYPSRAESEHDWVENSHASTSLSYADGLAKAFAVRGDSRPVVAVVGDGALTGGMAWEALNNIAAAAGPPGRHRRQRQRPLLLADHRGSGRRAGHPAAAARATRTRSTPSARRCTGRRSSGRRCTTRCTRSRRASRTSSRRRGCSRTSA